jgi:hypothetical protein
VALGPGIEFWPQGQRHQRQYSGSKHLDKSLNDSSKLPRLMTVYSETPGMRSNVDAREVAAASEQPTTKAEAASS